MAIFGPKPWVNPFGKMSIFGLFKLLVFFSLKRRFFVLVYRKRHFPALHCLKQKLGKMAILGPKPWVNPFGKMSIFGLFDLLVFIAQKGVFSFQNIVKDIFLAYIALKKKVGKMAFWDQNHGLTRQEKGQFLDFLNFLFFSPRTAFFFQNIVKRQFPGLFRFEKKLEKWPFLDQNHGLTPLEKCQFLDFLNFLFFLA